MKVTDQSPCRFFGDGDREVGMVRHALENRDIPQNSEVGLQNRGFKAANLRAANKVDLVVLRNQLANLLDDDGRTRESGWACIRCVHEGRDESVGSRGEKESGIM